ncbi:hypothetical protein [Tateyamaria omphalii]|nr:hypothetical protein [Tateyamaria omphalii]
MSAIADITPCAAFFHGVPSITEGVPDHPDMAHRYADLSQRHGPKLPRPHLIHRIMSGAVRPARQKSDPAMYDRRQAIMSASQRLSVPSTRIGRRRFGSCRLSRRAVGVVGQGRLWAQAGPYGAIGVTA